MLWICLSNRGIKYAIVPSCIILAAYWEMEKNFYHIIKIIWDFFLLPLCNSTSVLNNYYYYFFFLRYFLYSSLQHSQVGQVGLSPPLLLPSKLEHVASISSLRKLNTWQGTSIVGTASCQSTSISAKIPFTALQCDGHNTVLHQTEWMKELHSMVYGMTFSRCVMYSCRLSKLFVCLAVALVLTFICLWRDNKK